MKLSVLKNNDIADVVVEISHISCIAYVNDSSFDISDYFLKCFYRNPCAQKHSPQLKYEFIKNGEYFDEAKLIKSQFSILTYIFTLSVTLVNRIL